MARGRKSEGAGRNFSICLDDELRERLERDAKGKGHSLNKEIRLRLERSTREEERIADTFGDPRTYAFFRLLHLAVPLLSLGGRHRRGFWMDDRAQYRAVATAIQNILAALEPREKKARLEWDSDGVVYAGLALECLRTPRPDLPPEELQEVGVALDKAIEAGIHQALGRYAERIPPNMVRDGLLRLKFKGDKP